MIGVAIALIVIGIVFVFVIPWVGFVVGIVGLLLFIAFVAGFGRRAADDHQFEEGLAGLCTLSGRDARSEARTQGSLVPERYGGD